MRPRPLGMNLRNRIIKSINPEQNVHLVKDKLAYKMILINNNIPTPRTFFVIRKISDIHDLEYFPDEFVLKPNKGYGGNGVLILRRVGSDYFTPTGYKCSLHFIKMHIEKILDGQFSESSETDSVLIEQRIYPSQRLMFKDPVGIPDIRVFCYNYKAVMAMIRYPTRESQGKANLSCGALGFGLDIVTGSIITAYSKKEKRYIRLDDVGIQKGFTLPNWKLIKVIGERCAILAGLGLCGVDIILDYNDNIIVLEANGYPGIEIQNVTMDSLWRKIVEDNANRTV